VQSDQYRGGLLDYEVEGKGVVVDHIRGKG